MCDLRTTCLHCDRYGNGSEDDLDDWQGRDLSRTSRRTRTFGHLHCLSAAEDDADRRESNRPIVQLNQKQLARYGRYSHDETIIPKIS